MKTISIFALILLLNITLFCEDSIIEFQVKTKTFNGHYSPKNVGAIWIEDAQNNFVKTLKVWGDKRLEHLVKWNNISNGNYVDAVTGATKSTHISHEVQWNCIDVNQNIIEDGLYKIYVEFTEDNSDDNGEMGKWTSLDFEKSDSSFSFNPDDQTYFENIQLNYICNECFFNVDTKFSDKYKLYENYPNPFNTTTRIKYSIHKESKISLKIYDINGYLISTLFEGKQIADTYSYKWFGRNNSGRKVPSGVYIYRLKADEYSETKKMVLIY